MQRRRHSLVRFHHTGSFPVSCTLELHDTSRPSSICHILGATSLARQNRAHFDSGGFMASPPDPRSWNEGVLQLQSNLSPSALELFYPSAMITFYYLVFTSAGNAGGFAKCEFQLLWHRRFGHTKTCHPSCAKPVNSTAHYKPLSYHKEPYPVPYNPRLNTHVLFHAHHHHHLLLPIYNS